MCQRWTLYLFTLDLSLTLALEASCVPHSDRCGLGFVINLSRNRHSNDILCPYNEMRSLAKLLIVMG